MCGCWMLEVGRGLDLREEPFGSNDCGQLRLQHLERDVPVVLQVLGEIHRSHAALAADALLAQLGEPVGDQFQAQDGQTASFCEFSGKSVERRTVVKRRYRPLRAGPSATCITYAASSVQRTGDGFSSSRISSAVVPLNGPSYSFFALYAATARRTTGCSSGVKSMTVI